MDKIEQVFAWLESSFHAFNAIVSNPQFVPAMYFALVILATVALGVFTIWLVARNSNKADVYRPDLKTHLDFFAKDVKFFGLGQGERIVAVSRNTINGSTFKDGDKVRLEISVSDAAMKKGQYVPTTIRVRKLSKHFKDDQVQISRSAINEFGVEIAAEDIKYAKLKPLMAFENLWARSFADPDQNVRLTWILSFWSLLASTVAGVIVGHLHL